MRTYDDFDDDNLDDDDELDNFAKSGGSKTRGSAEDKLSAKYSDYLMWRDTGSSHDEALDLANMTEEEYATAEAADDSSDSSGFDSFDDDLDDDNLDDDDDSFNSQSSKRGSKGRYDDDDY